MKRKVAGLGCALLVLSLTACSTLPPGHDYPKTRSVESAAPEQTQLGRRVLGMATAHTSQNGFRMISVGVDGFLARLELINSAEKTLDLQYYIYHGDETGQLITEALAKAARRGVRIRILVDDGETEPGDEQLFNLASTQGVEIRVYNPWRYRGHARLWRDLEFVLNHGRLDYRMHNKLLVADNAIALVGGRNIGDQYFQVDPNSQFADDDVFTIGPVVQELGAKFDEFWNSDLAIPSAAIGEPTWRARHDRKPARAHAPDDKPRNAGFNYAGKLAAGEPLEGLLSGSVQLSWAKVLVLCDSPDKKDPREAGYSASLIYKPVADAVKSVQRELLLISPYFVPSKGERRLLADLRAHNARVAALTNSLQSIPEVAAHAGYMHYRPELLGEGVELYEVRPNLESTRGSGQSARISRYGNYALHGKLMVFDRSRLFAGSLNFDQRSRYINTEIGLIIDSPEMSQQIVSRFDAMTKLESAYTVILRPDGKLAWKTREHDQVVVYDKEPARSLWQRVKVHLLTLLPLDREL